MVNVNQLIDVVSWKRAGKCAAAGDVSKDGQLNEVDEVVAGGRVGFGKFWVASSFEALRCFALLKQNWFLESA